jgi:hypothetical protein
VRPRRLIILLATATILAAVGVALPSLIGGSTNATKHQAAGNATHIAHAKLTFAPVTQPGSLAPPAIPPSGEDYLGAWVQPNTTPGAYISDPKIETEEADLGEFQAQFGRPLGLVHVYQDWDEPVSNSLLDAISSTGAIPVIDWSCGSVSGSAVTTSDVAAGDDDAQIISFAQQLKAYGKPVFLRWLWEPNLDSSGLRQECLHTAGNTEAQDGANYVAAWQRIWNIFKGSGANSVGATNVAFVWNPGLAGDISTATLDDLWPGTQYVDWIGIDGYSRPYQQQDNCVPPEPNFAQMFATPSNSNCANPVNLYTTLTSTAPFAGPNGNTPLPLMIGETGALNPNGNPNHQTAFLEGSAGSILSDFQAGDFPDIKAVNYYDGTNPDFADEPWTLDPQVESGGSPPSGFDAFAILGASPIFGFLDPG